MGERVERSGMRVDAAGPGSSTGALPSPQRSASASLTAIVVAPI